MARQFYCMECRKWLDSGRDRGTRAARREHAQEHTAAAKMFSRTDLLELDVLLNSMYEQGS